MPVFKTDKSTRAVFGSDLMIMVLVIWGGAVCSSVLLAEGQRTAQAMGVG